MKIIFSSRANREARRILEYYTLEAGAEIAWDFHSELKAVTDLSGADVGFGAEGHCLANVKSRENW